MAQIKSLTAQKRWQQIPEDIQRQILACVWCGICLKGQPIVDYTMTYEDDMVIIRGKCKRCGGEVARVIENPDY